jgi:hypothetical protein
MARRKWIGAVAIATTCALVGAAGGIASSGAATSAKSSTSSSKSANQGGPGGPGGMGGGLAVHSESVQLNKAGTAYITVTQDQGTVTALSGSDITLKEGTTSVTYKTATITVAAGATVTRDDKTAALSDIKVGDRVSISSSTDGSYVRATDPSYKPAFGRGGMGGPGGGHGGPPPASSSSSSSSSSSGG